jgi:MFS family permease
MRAGAHPALTRNQLRGFWAAWGGWALDGMDSFIYALVLVPALSDLLPRSGMPASPSTVGFYGGLLFALFLIGWGFSLLWGPVADKFGRARALALTILCYSVFTLLSAITTRVWQLALFRVLAGVGIGGEWSMGSVFIAEEWPEERRKMGAGLMHTGFYFGIFLAGLANWAVGSRWGWRAMFVIGGTPALLVVLIRYGLSEPERWKSKRRQIEKPGRQFTMRQALLEIFSAPYRRRTTLNSIYLLVSIIGLWAGSVYVPASVTYLAAQAGFSALPGARLASYATMLLSAGTILGCVLVPGMAERLGRRLTLGLFSP